MDNILDRAFNFIFFPESQLSWFFVAVFLVCFTYGWVQRHKCVKKLDGFSGEEYGNSDKIISPEQYVEDFDNKLSAEDIKIIDLPNVFVSVGIVGTFLGLGIGLQGATDLLSSEKIDIRQLNEVLGVLAFKFQTSVWGTLCSLLFQKMVLEPYYKIREDKLSSVRNKLSSYAMQCSVEKNLSDISNNLTEHCRGIANSYRHFVDASGQFKDNVAQCIVVLEQYKEELVQSQHVLSEYYGKHCDALDQFAKKNDETADNICEAFKNSSKAFVEMAGSDLSKNMKDSLGSIHYEYMKETETIKGTINKLGEALQAFKEVSEQLNGNNTIMRENLGKCRGLLESYSENIRTAIDSVNTMAKNVANTGVTQQENLNKTLGDVVRQVSPLFEKISKEHGESVKKFTDMQESFNDFVKGWKNQETLQQSELKGIVQELDKKQGDKLSTIVDGVQKLSEKKGTIDGEEQLLNKLQDVISNQKMQLEEEKKLTKALELLSEKLESIKSMEQKDVAELKQD